MGMGHAPAFIVEIEGVNIEKLKLPTHQKLLDTLNKHNVTFDEFTQIIDEINRTYLIERVHDYIEEMCHTYDIEEKPLREIIASYQSFCDEFDDEYGLTISCGYHDSEEKGDRYDDVNGGYYCLNFGEIYELSDKAKALQKDAPFQISQFVIFG